MCTSQVLEGVVFNGILEGRAKPSRAASTDTRVGHRQKSSVNPLSHFHQDESLNCLTALTPVTKSIVKAVLVDVNPSNSFVKYICCCCHPRIVLHKNLQRFVVAGFVTHMVHIRPCLSSSSHGQSMKETPERR